ncbi:VOC family protein [Georgenia subflava]|uniref:Extradiol dioxygenase n=1 Tax=Georgenia subflava TaxID=1622177 RepID=A0A6N7EJ59_9MICO|nr:VOC family protein [Georgenia subflava]MPV37461.1 extradiol dioxygenase [Georgenia subflava]
MPLDHLGINVPDVAPARRYYDALMPLVGFEPFVAGEDWFSYAPARGDGTQLFFYTAQEVGSYSRRLPGLQHLCFRVGSRQEVEAAHAWAHERGDEILHAPRTFPEYHPDHYATYWLDPHGFKLEVVSFEHVG